MEYLIDGHNLIAKMPDIALEDPDDEAKLILRLRSWAAAKQKRKVTVYFDGGLPGGQDRYLSNQTVSAVFATTGSTADTLLINRIKRVKNPAEYTLISSDREVKNAAEIRKMRIISAASMASRLGAISHRKSENESMDVANRETKLTEHEIDEWLEIFSENQDSSPKS